MENLTKEDKHTKLCVEHIWKAYDMPYYVRCVKGGKQWHKNMLYDE